MTPEIFTASADFRGDSLQLAREAAKTNARVIVQAGVHFMAETAKILSPDKTVLIPDMKAGCSLAASITGADVRLLRQKYPGLPVVTYVNTSAEVKAESDITCTSSNAVDVVESIARERGVDTVIMIPDEYLARNVAKLTKVKIIAWHGRCEVHERFTAQNIRDYRASCPGVVVLAHPECSPEVIAEADFAGSTSAMIGYVGEKRPAHVVLVTECSMSDNVAAEYPDVDFVRPCNLCPHMKRITLAKIRHSLETMTEEVFVDRSSRRVRARRSRRCCASARRRRGRRLNVCPTASLLEDSVTHADNIVEVPGALILGAGAGGLFTALKLAPYPSLIVTGVRAGQSGSSFWAQGGIAAAVAKGDSWERHAADTVAAGAGLVDPAMAALLAREGPARIDDLIRIGVPFDRDENGDLAVSREAAHSCARVVHVHGDSTGASLTQTLAETAAATPSIAFAEGFRAIEVAVEDGRVVGIFARTGSGASSRLVLFRARAVVFATGGLGALYAVTTNPPESRGEGLGMAARAGAVIADPEFVQFHPTAIAVGRDPAPLATEALRGAGATLVNDRGERFMQAVHEMAELAPRDIVARGIHREIAKGRRVFLDCRKAIGGAFAAHFPTVYAAAMAAGIDPSRELLPVAPAAHYHMGGIATDANAKSSLAGLWAVGECASTGVHGANRLASNSLLETLVFGARAGRKHPERVAGCHRACTRAGARALVGAACAARSARCHERKRRHRTRRRRIGQGSRHHRRGGTRGPAANRRC